MERGHQLLQKLVIHSTGEKITVSIGEPQHKVQMGGTSRYYLFPITGIDDKGPINVQRRYSAFDQLRNVLLSRWPGILIPSLPEKKLKLNVENSFINHRRRSLQEFLNQLAHLPFLWYSEQTQLFLKNQNVEVDKPLLAMSINKIEDTVGKYMSTFPNLQKSEVKQQQYNMINKLKEKIQAHIKKIDQVQWQLDTATTIRRRYNQKTNLLLGKTLVQYEKNILLQNMTFMNCQDLESKLTFGKPNFFNREEIKQYQDQLKSNHDDIQLLTEGIKSEKREEQALLEALKIRQQYTAKKLQCQNRAKQQELQHVKISQGGVSMISKMRNSSAQQQLRQNQNEIEQVKLQLNSYSYICKAIDVLLISNGLKIFLSNRQQNYYRLIKRIAQEQLKINRSAKNFWNYISHLEMGQYVESQSTGIQQKYSDKEQSSQSNSPRKLSPEKQKPKAENLEECEQINENQ